MPISIDDARDERLTDYVGLTDVALRRRLDPENGLYIAESEKVIRRALAAGHRPPTLLMGQPGIIHPAHDCEPAHACGLT